MISTQFWSFKSSCYLPNIACVVKRERAAGEGGGGGWGVGKKRRRDENKERGLGREGRERLL